MVQLVSVVVPPIASSPPPSTLPGADGVAADGAVGQRMCLRNSLTPPPPLPNPCSGRLPLMVLLVSVAVPLDWMSKPPPPPSVAELPLTVQLLVSVIAALS